MTKRIVNLSILPGQPTDGSGRVCVHFFVLDEVGPIVEPYVSCAVVKDGKPTGDIESRPVRGRLACDPKRLVAPVTRGNVTTVTFRSNDPRAVNCPKCMATAAYKEMKLKPPYNE